MAETRGRILVSSASRDRLAFPDPGSFELTLDSDANRDFLSYVIHIKLASARIPSTSAKMDDGLSPPYAMVVLENIVPVPPESGFTMPGRQTSLPAGVIGIVQMLSKVGNGHAYCQHSDAGVSCDVPWLDRLRVRLMFAPSSSPGSSPQPFVFDDPDTQEWEMSLEVSSAPSHIPSCCNCLLDSRFASSYDATTGDYTFDQLSSKPLESIRFVEFASLGLVVPGGGAGDPLAMDLGLVLCEGVHRIFPADAGWMTPMPVGTEDPSNGIVLDSKAVVYGPGAILWFALDPGRHRRGQVVTSQSSRWTSLSFRLADVAQSQSLVLRQDTELTHWFATVMLWQM